jgi:hypothetical protein
MSDIGGAGYYMTLAKMFVEPSGKKLSPPRYWRERHDSDSKQKMER